MNQTRLFLIFAWLMVATLLWMEWGKEKQAAITPATPVAAVAAPPAMVPGQATPTAPSAVPTANAPSIFSMRRRPWVARMVAASEPAAAC